jgi:hypothetical protein
MPSLPWDLVVQLLLLDLVLAIGASVFVGCLLAFAIDRPIWMGVLVGAALPLVGPLVWAVQAKLTGSFDNRFRPPLDSWLRWSLAVALAIPGAAYIIAMGLPWEGAEGNVKGYSALGEASPLDSVVGAVGLGLGALILIGSALSLIWASRWWASALVVGVSGFWLAMTLDTLILSDAVNHLSVRVAGLVGGIGEAHVSTGSGAWTVLAASVVALAGGLFLGVVVSRRNAVPLVLTADSAIVTTGFDYGDGF